MKYKKCTKKLCIVVTVKINSRKLIFRKKQNNKNVFFLKKKIFRL